MPTRKTSAKSARKTSTKASKARGLDLDAIKAGQIVLYGIPIRDAIRRGNLAEMRALAILARKHVREVQAALNALEKSIGK